MGDPDHMWQIHLGKITPLFQFRQVHTSNKNLKQASNPPIQRSLKALENYRHHQPLAVIQAISKNKLYRNLVKPLHCSSKKIIQKSSSKTTKMHLSERTQISKQSTLLTIPPQNWSCYRPIHLSRN